MMFFRKMKVFIVSLLGAFLLSFLLGETESGRLSHQRSEQLIEQNNKQFFFIENVFASMTLILEQTSFLYDGKCSNALLNFMRKSIFNTDGAIEIGIIDRNGNAICTSWGKKNFSVKKPVSHEGFLLSGPHTSNFYDERISVIKKTTDDYEFNMLIKQSSVRNLLQNIQISSSPKGEGKLKPYENEIQSKFVSNIFYTYQSQEHIKASNLFYFSIFLLSFSLFYFIIIPYLVFSFNKASLKRKILTDVFFNVYQPIIDTKNNTVFSYEIFTRCKGQNNAISIIKDIKRYNLHVEHTLRQFEKLEEEKERFDCQNFQVNLSARHLTDDRMVTYLSKIAIASRREIIIEITEDEDLFKNRKKVKDSIRQLRNLEYRFALDDFGSGFSNFSYIFEFEFDFIKIDKSVLRFKNDAFFQSFVKIFDTLETPCIIEGVEDEADKLKLDNIEIQYHQGWLYGKPKKAPTE
ncbi:MAG: EAL domain-containing protein [Marinomonas colpomeniae]